MMLRYLFLLCGIFFLTAHGMEKPIVVFVPSYNNIQFYKKNLDSIFAQEYANYFVVYVDDCSTDGTGDAVAAYIQEHQYEGKIALVRNDARRGALYNHYNVAHALPNSVIMATLDGDDWFPDGNTNVFARVNEAYQDPHVWMTYGQFAEYPSGNIGFCRPLADWPRVLHAYRDYPWVFSHLRTCYAGLFKQIPVGYFIRGNSFLQATCDLAIMFSLLELAEGRAWCINEVIYTYNTTNGQSDGRTRFFEQVHNDHWVRARVPLKPLALHPAHMSQETPTLYNIHLSTHSVEAWDAYCASIAQGGILLSEVMVIRDGADAKAQLTAHLDTFPEETYILITTDGCAWQSCVNWQLVMKMLARTKALSYAATIGEKSVSDTSVTHALPTMIPLHDTFLAWKPAEAQGICHHPYAAQAFLIHKTTLQHALAQINGKTVEELLDNLAYLAVENNDDVVLCTIQAPCLYKG